MIQPNMDVKVLKPGYGLTSDADPVQTLSYVWSVQQSLITAEVINPNFKAGYVRVCILF